MYNKGSLSSPKWMNFRKISKRPLTPPSSFSENHIAIFSEIHDQSIAYNGKNLQYRFLDWKLPPGPLRNFSKNNPFWMCKASLNHEAMYTVLDTHKMRSSFPIKRWFQQWFWGDYPKTNPFVKYLECQLWIKFTIHRPPPELNVKCWWCSISVRISRLEKVEGEFKVFFLENQYRLFFLCKSISPSCLTNS